ncbi:MAG: cyclic pyranopterin monophosphate synthase MoaC [Actinobacteria bacterium]|nr:cyclic pyranopterin monophosphate synthase MoaC [Actinomycetota bacterium]
MAKKSLTHLNEEGRARMVDVGGKEITAREATAEAIVSMKAKTMRLIKEGAIKKGDVLAVAQVAGIMAAKRTPDAIPMCHPIQITGVDINFRFIDDEHLVIEAIVRTLDRTGVEMEALNAAATAALTVYDMAKAVDRGMTVERVRLLAKSGGKSGIFKREER